jgi:hypothetical protein
LAGEKRCCHILAPVYKGRSIPHVSAIVNKNRKNCFNYSLMALPVDWKHPVLHSKAF